MATTRKQDVNKVKDSYQHIKKTITARLVGEDAWVCEEEIKALDAAAKEEDMAAYLKKVGNIIEGIKQEGKEIFDALEVMPSDQALMKIQAFARKNDLRIILEENIKNSKALEIKESQDEVNFLIKAQSILTKPFSTLKNPDQRKEFALAYARLQAMEGVLSEDVFRAQSVADLEMLHQSLRHLGNDKRNPTASALTQAANQLAGNIETRKNFMIIDVKANQQRDALKSLGERFQSKIESSQSVMRIKNQHYSDITKADREAFTKNFMKMDNSDRLKIVDVQNEVDLIEMSKNKKINNLHVVQMKNFAFLENKKFHERDENEQKTFIALFSSLSHEKDKKHIVNLQSQEGLSQLSKNRHLSKQDRELISQRQTALEKSSYQQNKKYLMLGGQYLSLSSQQKTDFVNHYLALDKKDRLLVLKFQSPASRQLLSDDLENKADKQFINNYHKKLASQQSIVSELSKKSLLHLDKNNQMEFIKKYHKLSSENKLSVLSKQPEASRDALLRFEISRNSIEGRGERKLIQDYNEMKEIAYLSDRNLIKTLKTNQDRHHALMKLMNYMDLPGGKELDHNVKALFSQQALKLGTAILLDSKNKLYGAASVDEKKHFLDVYTFVLNDQKKALALSKQSPKDRKEFLVDLKKLAHSNDHHNGLYESTFSKTQTMLIEITQKEMSQQPAQYTGSTSGFLKSLNVSEQSSMPTRDFRASESLQDDSVVIPQSAIHPEQDWIDSFKDDSGFRQALDKDSVVDYLKNQAPGTYVIRPSSQANAVVFSVVDHQNKIQEFRLTKEHYDAYRKCEGVQEIYNKILEKNPNTIAPLELKAHQEAPKFKQ